MAGYTKDVIRVLKDAGCYFLRPAKGDHQWWYSPITNLNFVVDSDIKSRHTANQIMKQAGLPKQF